MTKYTRWASRTGEIFDVIDIPQDEFDRHNVTLFEGEIDSQSHYFVDGVPVEKPVYPASISSSTINLSLDEEFVFSDVVIGSQVTILGDNYFRASFETTSDEVRIQAAAVGEYEIIFELFPYLTKTFHVTAIQD